MCCEHCEYYDKTIISSIYPDDDMPYLTEETYTDEYGVVHAKGKKERVELLTNSLAIVNRTIPMALLESSITFILDKTRKHMATLENLKDAKEFMFDIIEILNKKQAKELRNVYKDLSDREQRKFIESAIKDGIFIRWEAFSADNNLRDAIIEIYEKYEDIIQPYHVFVPKTKWGRDIYIGQDYIGFQYMLLLKQSGESGFSVRSAGAISDESLPEKTFNNKLSKALESDTPIRFGEPLPTLN